jgi:phosphoribosylformylglycinamidine synthase
MSKYRALILSAPGSRGERYFDHALRSVGFDSEILTMPEVLDYRIDLDQLCLKYKVLVIPGGNSYSSVLGGGKVLSLKMKHLFRWNLQKFAERGGLVLGVGTGFQALLHMNVFGEDYTLRSHETSESVVKWVKAVPTGNRCVWLKGMGTIELPVNLKDTEFVIEAGALVEAKGRLDRLGLSCLKASEDEKVLGLCDITGRIFGLTPHPEFFLNWTNAEDWFLNPTRAAAPGQGYAIFENAAKYCEQT